MLHEQPSGPQPGLSLLIDSPEPMLRGHLLLRGADAAPPGGGQRLQDIWTEPARDREPSKTPSQPLNTFPSSALRNFQEGWVPLPGCLRCGHQSWRCGPRPPPHPPSSPFPLSPVSSSRKARQCLASRGSRTQPPAPAAHSSRRLCPARPSSMLLRSCRGMARVGCSQPAGGPLWRQ